MPTFHYTPPITAAFPTIVGGVMIGTVTNAPTPDDLKAAYIAGQQAVIARIGSTPLSDLDSLAAWRSAFRLFNVDPTKYRSAAEALLRRLTKQGDIPSINTLVDVGNMVSIRYGLPVAVLDVRGLVGEGIAVGFAAGDETFYGIGVEEGEHPEKGEVIFADEGGNIYARRWCWRQSKGSAAQPDTTRVIVTVEGHHGSAQADVTAALNDLQQLLTQYAGFSGSAGIVSAREPRFAG